MCDDVAVELLYTCVRLANAADIPDPKFARQACSITMHMCVIRQSSRCLNVLLCVSAHDIKTKTAPAPKGDCGAPEGKQEANEQLLQAGADPDKDPPDHHES